MSTPGDAQSPTAGAWSPQRLIWISLALFAGAVLVKSLTDRSVTETISDSAEEIPIVQARADFPFSVREGEQFEVRITIRNADSVEAVLQSIDIEEDLHDGFDLARRPEGWEATELGYIIEYLFNEEIPAEQTIEKVFVFLAGEEGYYEGDLDVWHDDNAITFPVLLEVTAADSGPGENAPESPAGAGS